MKLKHKFFDLCKKLTSKSTHHSHAISCVIVKKNRVISVGWNELKTHSQSLHEFKFRHAEFNAILNTPINELQGATAYIYREHRNGKPAMARPCSSCMKSLKLVGIKNLCYSTNNSFTEELI